MPALRRGYEYCNVANVKKYAPHVWRNNFQLTLPTASESTGTFLWETAYKLVIRGQEGLKVCHMTSSQPISYNCWLGSRRDTFVPDSNA